MVKNLGEIGIKEMLAGEITNGGKNSSVKRRATWMGTGQKMKVGLDTAAGGAGRALKGSAAMKNGTRG